MNNFLVNKKTHIVAAGIVVAAIVSFLTGEVTLAEAINQGLTGLGLSALRLGVANK